MANAFKFSNDNQLELDIEGKKYILEAGSPEQYEKLEKMAVDSVEAARRAKESDSVKDTILGMCASIGQSIDDLLGEGEYKRIFSGRGVVSLFDHLDVLRYITESVREKYEERYARYAPDRVKRPIAQ